MKQLKIKDNDQRKKEEFFEIPGLVKTIADKITESYINNLLKMFLF